MKANFWGKYLLKNVWLFLHSIIMAGKPGNGKTLLARGMPSILPEMSIEESLDVTRIYSVADQLSAGMPLIRHRPFHALGSGHGVKISYEIKTYRTNSLSRGSKLVINDV